MKVTFSRRSLRQLEEIHAYLAQHNPDAAHRVVSRIQELCERLADFPGIGTQTDQSHVRMLPVVRYPSNIFYAVFDEKDEVRILRIRHGARRRVRISRHDPGED